MLVEKRCSFRTYKKFIIKIDLKERKCISALLSYNYKENYRNRFPEKSNSRKGYRNLTMNEVLILIWFNLIFHSHVKIHSLGNWAVNLDSGRSFFDRTQSLCTVLLNYYGKKFPSLSSNILYRIGILPCRLNELHFVFNDAESKGAFPNTKCTGFKNNSKENEIYHSQKQHRCMSSILFKYSRHVRFVTRLHNVFLKLFDQFETQFPGINGEALFVGGILHSLDHCIMENLSNPFWLDATHPEFGLMASLGQVVRVMFVEDLPGLLFKKRYKDSNKGTFWHNVYETASLLDQELADKMDCGIIK